MNIPGIFNVTLKFIIFTLLDVKGWKNDVIIHFSSWQNHRLLMLAEGGAKNGNLSMGPVNPSPNSQSLTNRRVLMKVQESGKFKP